jgi:hypothetical protein
MGLLWECIDSKGIQPKFALCDMKLTMTLVFQYFSWPGCILKCVPEVLNFTTHFSSPNF